jgi:hypothetical protein
MTYKAMGRILNRMLLCAALATAGTSAIAQDFDALSRSSALIKKDLDYLKRKKARSIFASEKPYCPSTYWWSNVPSSNQQAKHNYAGQLTAEMSRVGFSKTQINHCIKNSKFLLKNSELQPHKLNREYISFVQAAVMVVRDNATGKKSSQPVTIETKTWGGQRYQRVFNAQFKELCRNTGVLAALTSSCKGYGTLKGRIILGQNSRATYKFSNAKYDMAISIRRSKSYAMSNFSKLFK